MRLDCRVAGHPNQNPTQRPWTEFDGRTLQSLRLLVDEAATPSPIPVSAAQGGLWAFGGQLALAGSWLVTLPFLIRFLGPEQFGIFSLINAIIGCLAFSDFGMGVASTRFGARAHALGDVTGETQAVWTALGLSLSSAALVATAVVTSSRWLMGWLGHLPPDRVTAASVALDVAVAASFFRVASSVLNTPQLVRMRIDTNSKVLGAINVFQMSATVAVVLAGGRLLAVVTVGLAAMVANAGAQFMASRRLLPRLWPPSASMGLLVPLTGFGAPMVASMIFSAVFGQAEKLLLIRLASPVALGQYSVAFLVSTVFSLGSAALATALVPPFSRLHALGDGAGLQHLYRKILVWTFALAAPAATTMIVFGRTFFTLWAGPAYATITTRCFQILIIGAVINLLTNVPYHALISVGRTKLLALVHLVEVPVYLGAAVVLIWRYGAIGAAAAWTLRIAIDAILTFAAAAHYVRLTFTGRLLAKGVTAMAILAVPLLVLHRSAGIVLPVVALASALALYGYLVRRVLLPGREKAGRQE